MSQGWRGEVVVAYNDMATKEESLSKKFQDYSPPKVQIKFRNKLRVILPTIDDGTDNEARFGVDQQEDPVTVAIPFEFRIHL